VADLQGLFAIGGEADVITLVAEQVCERLPEAFVVVYDQDVASA
jgi:hypothetical protein